jgi:hypothetical protein
MWSIPQNSGYVAHKYACGRILSSSCQTKSKISCMVITHTRLKNHKVLSEFPNHLCVHPSVQKGDQDILEYSPAKIT